MRELDGRIVAGDQSSGHEPLEERFVLYVRGDGSARDRAPDWLAFGCRGDEPEQQVTEQRALVLGDLFVERFG